MGHFQQSIERPMTELKTLEDKIKSWVLVERTPDMNVLPSTWAFKLKRFPDLLPEKFEARFCVQGDFSDARS